MVILKVSFLSPLHVTDAYIQIYRYITHKFIYSNIFKYLMEQNPKIVVSKETKLELDKMKLYKSQTYDEIITLLIQVWKKLQTGEIQ